MHVLVYGCWHVGVLKHGAGETAKRHSERGGPTKEYQRFASPPATHLARILCVFQTRNTKMPNLLRHSVQMITAKNYRMGSTLYTYIPVRFTRTYHMHVDGLLSLGGTAVIHAQRSCEGYFGGGPVEPNWPVSCLISLALPLCALRAVRRHGRDPTKPDTPVPGITRRTPECRGQAWRVIPFCPSPCGSGPRHRQCKSRDCWNEASERRKQITRSQRARWKINSGLDAHASWQVIRTSDILTEGARGVECGGVGLGRRELARKHSRDPGRSSSCDPRSRLVAEGHHRRGIKYNREVPPRLELSTVLFATPR